jgi:hypothetical protein
MFQPRWTIPGLPGFTARLIKHCGRAIEESSVSAGTLVAGPRNRQPCCACCGSLAGLTDLEAGIAGGFVERIELSEAERGELEARSQRRKIARTDVVRGETVLLAADGLTCMRRRESRPQGRRRSAAAGGVKGCQW